MNYIKIKTKCSVCGCEDLETEEYSMNEFPEITIETRIACECDHIETVTYKVVEIKHKEEQDGK